MIKKYWSMADLEKGVVSVTELIKLLKEFPSMHYSSLERDRIMADEIVNRLIAEFSVTKHNSSFTENPEKDSPKFTNSLRSFSELRET